MDPHRFRPLIRWAVRKTAEMRGRNLGASEADDLVQEVFVALLENDSRRLKQFDPAKGKLESWIAMIARQTTLKKLEPLPPPPLPEHLEAPGLEQPVDLQEALKTLPPREALCLALLVEQGMEAGRVASILGVRRQGVYEIRERALEKIRRWVRTNA